MNIHFLMKELLMAIKKGQPLSQLFFSKENTKNTHLIRIFNDIDQHFEL